MALINVDERTHPLLNILFRMGCRSYTMRNLTTLSLVLCLLSGQAQSLTISDLICMTNCQDTACIAAFARPKGMCFQGGKEKDGWIWLPCGQKVEDPMGVMSTTTLGFVGYPGSYYYRYVLGTRDTTQAALLTKEFEQLGFKKERPQHGGFVYVSGEYPGLEIELAEVRSGNIVPKRPDDSKNRYNKPLSELPEPESNSLREQGFDSYDLIPSLVWVFRALVRK
jgi:hypothetical protein